MKKIKLIMSSGEYFSYMKGTFSLLIRLIVRAPLLVLVTGTSIICWLTRLLVRFCREQTKAAVIVGFALCLFVMFFEFVYFKIKLAEESDKTGILLKKNYELEQKDRYDIGYHDGMKECAEHQDKKNE